MDLNILTRLTSVANLLTIGMYCHIQITQAHHTKTHSPWTLHFSIFEVPPSGMLLPFGLLVQRHAEYSKVPYSDVSVVLCIQGLWIEHIELSFTDLISLDALNYYFTSVLIFKHVCIRFDIQIFCTWIKVK